MFDSRRYTTIGLAWQVDLVPSSGKASSSETTKCQRLCEVQWRQWIIPRDKKIIIDLSGVTPMRSRQLILITFLSGIEHWLRRVIVQRVFTMIKAWELFGVVDWHEVLYILVIDCSWSQPRVIKLDLMSCYSGVPAWKLACLWEWHVTTINGLAGWE